MPNSRKPVVPFVTLDGTDIPSDFDTALISLEVRNSVHRAGAAELQFKDPNYALFDASPFDVGKILEVKLTDGGNGLISVFKGPITMLGTDQGMDASSSSTRLVVGALSGSHPLAAAAVFTAYLEQTVDDIVGAVAGRHGLSAEVASGAGAVRDYTLQADTDHAFLTGLARQVGCEWFVADQTLHFRPRASASGPTLKRSDGSLSRFRASYSGEHVPKDVKVYGWQTSAKSSVNGAAGAAASSPSSAQLGSDAPFVAAQHANAHGSFACELMVGIASAGDAAAAEAIATSVALDLVSSGLEVEGMAPGDPTIKAGASVTIDEVGERLAGSYYVTEVVHRFGGGSATTTFHCDGHGNESSALPSSLLGGGAGGTSWGQLGLMIAVVTNVADPDNLGRVKLTFPSLGEEVESDWARVVVPGVGEARGFDARPEVNDEVLVGFEHGDASSPFVLGGVWGPRSLPPTPDTSDSGHAVRRQIVSRVGHKITLSDGPDGAAAGDPERFVSIELADAQTSVHIGEDGIKIITGPDDDIELSNADGKANIKLTGAGDVIIKGENITLDAAQKVTIKGGGDVAVNAGAKLAIEGKTGLEAKSGAMGKLESSGPLTVKGATVAIN